MSLGALEERGVEFDNPFFLDLKRKILGREIFFFFFGRVVPLPQNSSQELDEATLCRRTLSVQRLAKSFGTIKQTDRHPVTVL